MKSRLCRRFEHRRCDERSCRLQLREECNCPCHAEGLIPGVDSECNEAVPMCNAD